MARSRAPHLLLVLLLSAPIAVVAVDAVAEERAGSAKVKRGTRHGDRLKGTARRDRLYGRRGNDRLLGRAGNDLLDGGSGNDRLDGGKGRDRLRGRSGRDRLNGGSGKDRLNGGSGRDRFSAGSGNDVIDAREPAKKSGARAAATSERVNCGRGRDRVLADRTDSLRSCEEVSFGGAGLTDHPAYPIEVVPHGSGSGRVYTVTRGTGGRNLDCRITRGARSGTCIVNYEVDEVSVLVVADHDSTLDGLVSVPGYGSDCEVSGDDLGKCAFTYDPRFATRRTINVFLNLRPPVTLTAVNPDKTNGRVISSYYGSHNGIQCGTGKDVCSVQYPYGFEAKVTLHWAMSGPISTGSLSPCDRGTGLVADPCIVLMRSDRTVTAEWEYK